MPSVLGREGPGSCFTATGLLSTGSNSIAVLKHALADYKHARMHGHDVGCRQHVDDRAWFDADIEGETLRVNWGWLAVMG